MMSVLLVIGLMVAGLGLLAVEILVIPGFGVVGILGLLGIAGSGYLAFERLTPAYGGLAIGGGVVGAALMFWLLPKTGVGKSMVLTTQQQGSAADPRLLLLVGREGKAVTPLRPSGTVEIDERPVDVVTDGVYVDSGTRVRVVSVEGVRVVVEPLA